MPPEILKTLPGYDPDVQKNRTDARQIMERLGYGPERRLKVKVLVKAAVPSDPFQVRVHRQAFPDVAFHQDPLDRPLLRCFCIPEPFGGGVDEDAGVKK
jgi:hypothetical protein